jgi:HEAT repeat protein
MEGASRFERGLRFVTTKEQQDQESPQGEQTPDSQPGSPDVSFGVSIVQFFLIPALVVVACVALFLFFGWLVAEEKSSLDHLHDIKTGSATRRWQAAFELAKQLNNMERLEQRSDADDLEGLVPGMIDVFESADQDDPRVRRYMALALGNVGDARAVPVLLGALSDDDPETRIYSIWALGSIGDKRALVPLLELAQDDDPGIRKMVVYSLGALRAEEARDTLRAALEDYQMDVAWNAAIALAQLGDASGKERILQMLDRDFLNTVADMSEAQRSDAMMTAMRGAVLLRDDQLRSRLADISAGDPDLKVRQAAFESLAQIDKLSKE